MLGTIVPNIRRDTMSSRRKNKAKKEQLQKEKLKKLGVEDVKVYFRTLPVIGNIYTACLFLDKDRNIISRGVTICSPLDTFEKEEGKKRSYKRAMKALHTKKSDLLINAFPLRWGDKAVKRQFTIKTEEDEKLILNYVQPTLSLMVDGKDINMSTNVCFKKIKGESGTNNIEVKKLIYDLPRETTVFLTSQEFKYKSYYKPVPTSFEIKLLSSKQ